LVRFWGNWQPCGPGGEIWRERGGAARGGPVKARVARGARSQRERERGEGDDVLAEPTGAVVETMRERPWGRARTPRTVSERGAKDFG
jgi:hypothetical protein